MTSLQLPASLVSAVWLRQHLDHQDLVLFDASWHMPATGRDAFTEWQQERIGGARFFDFDGRICDLQSSLPHMLPDADSFARELQLLGLKQNSCVVVYDSMGMISSPRAWWMLRVMGCVNVALLDGGLPAWKACRAEGILNMAITNSSPPMRAMISFFRTARRRIWENCNSTISPE